MNRIMLDLETMGINASAALLAIGAVRFGKGKIADKFYTVVDLQSSLDAGLQMDASTVLWWMEQSDEARGQFKRAGTPLIDALSEFSEWVGSDAEVWGNGAAFDNAILATAYRKVNIPQPWAFWNDRCYRTVKAMAPNVRLKRVGTYHNAVDDAESQALHLMELIPNL